MRGRPQRVVNASDDSELRMGDYFDLAADLHGLPRPPRISRAEAAAALSPLQMSFLGESRRLVNRRLKEELGVVLRHADGHEGLARFPRLRAERSGRTMGRRQRRCPCVPRCAGPPGPARPSPLPWRRCPSPSSATPPLPSRARAPAGAWPTKPIRLVSPFNPGGAIDVLNRVIAEKLGQRLGQQVFVDAVPGANTIVGADVVAKAAPDGYTFMITTMSTHVNNTVLFRKLPFDPVKDFAPITQVSLGSVLLTAPATAGYGDLKGFVAWAKQQNRPISLRLVGHRLVGQRLRRDPGQGPRREPRPTCRTRASSRRSPT